MRIVQMLLFLAVIVIAWLWVRRLLAPPAPEDDAAGGGGRTFEATARCAGCGTHVPRKELTADGRCERCRAGG